MKIVLFEYATGGGPGNGDEQPCALAREGELMLRALGRGLAALDGVRLVTVRDARLPPPDYPTAVARVEEGGDWSAAVADMLDAADAFWPIAPETGGVLADLCRLAQERHCLLLNSPARVVEETGSKYRACRRLRRNGLRCVGGERLDAVHFPRHRDVVVKPDDGVGCESTYLVCAGELPPRDLPARGNGGGDGYLCQPYLPGTAASLSVIYSPDAPPYILGVNRQEMALQRRRFSLRACHVNALARQALDCEQLAAGVQRSFPGVVGYVGIDFIVADDGALHVLEVNPRVTSSFAGLAASTGLNPCAEVVRAVCGEGSGPARAREAARERPSRQSFVPVEVRFDGHVDRHADGHADRHVDGHADGHADGRV